MRPAYRQRHLKQQHKSAHIRRNCYFRTYQQTQTNPLAPIAGFIPLQNMMKALDNKKREN